MNDATRTPIRRSRTAHRVADVRRGKVGPVLAAATAIAVLAGLVAGPAAALAPSAEAGSNRTLGTPVTGARVPATTAPAAPGGLRTALDPFGIQSFVIAVYVDFLGRQPSAEEIAAWGSRLQDGVMNTMDLTTAVSTSDEWISGVITDFYTDTLGRAPDPAGLAGWIAAARRGVPIAEIAAGFYGSPEYFATIGASDPATWVRDLYRKLLLREGEPGGVSGWLAALNGGVPRHQVALGFYQSLEKLTARIHALYGQLLGRTAEPAGVSGWTPVVAARGDLVLAASIAGSAEYWNRARTRFPGDGTPPAWVKVVGSGTPASCTSAALVAATRSGGTIVFDCGPNPVTIVVQETLYTCNTTTCQHPWNGGTPVASMTLDGGGLVTLSGGGARGIYYANACEDDFGWLTSRCDLETRPHITFQNITFANGNAAQGPPPGRADVGGGGAIAMRAGRLTLDHVTFRDNVCMTAHSDWGGGAVRVTGMTVPVEVLSSAFVNNRCANGGALSSLHAPMYIHGSSFTGNTATGSGASSGLGGNGGAIYFDGTHQNVTVVNTTITGNVAPEGGPGIFYVSNDRTGSLTIQGTTINGNSGQSFYTPPYRSLYFLGKTLAISGSTVQ